jgi:CheY-like chemotaxis protein
MIDAWGPQCVILDILMPGLCGLEVAAAVRHTGGCSETLLIAYSALCMPGDRNRAWLAGFDAFCRKPLDPAFLSGLLESLGARRVRLFNSASWRTAKEQCYGAPWAAQQLRSVH